MRSFLIICSCLAVAHSKLEKLPPGGSSWPTQAQKKDALFLTEYIRRNEATKGREKSHVEFFQQNFSVEAYSGYITTNDQNTSHLFFLYTKAQNSAAVAPVILWLYGGPGTSALTAQFVYNGPVGVRPGQHGLEFFERTSTLQKDYHVIYLDAPAGSGFSFANSTAGFDRTSKEVAISIKRFLDQFYKLFPELVGRQLYVNGESYAARYAVGLADMKGLRVPLSGIMLGIPFLGDVVEALNPTSFLSCVGMLDENGVNKFNERFGLIKKLFDAKDYQTALMMISLTILNSENLRVKTLYSNLTGFSWHGSALRSDMPPEIGFYYVLTNTSQFRQQIHVGKIVRESQRLDVVYSLAVGDFKTDLGKTFVRVLNSSLPVLIYTAKMDTVAPSPTFHSHFNKLPWFGAGEFRNTSREASFTTATYPSRQTLRYYKKEWKHVTLVDVEGAGHYVSIDKPKVVLEIVNKFIKKHTNSIKKKPMMPKN